MGAVLAVICGLALRFWSWGEPWIHASYDNLFRFGARAVTNQVVVVLMDNLGWGELGVYGGGILRGAPTPRVDKLASEGRAVGLSS